MNEHMPEDVRALLAEHEAAEQQLAALTVARSAAEGALTAAEESDRGAVATATRAAKPLPKMKTPAARAALEDRQAAERAALDVLGRIRQDLGALVRERREGITTGLREALSECLTDRVRLAVDDLLAAIHDDLEPLLASINWLRNPVSQAGVTQPRALLNTDPIDDLPAWLDRVIASRVDESQQEKDARIERDRQQISDEARALRQKERPDWEETKEFVPLDEYRERIEAEWRREGREPPHRPDSTYVQGYGSVLPQREGAVG